MWVIKAIRYTGSGCSCTTEENIATFNTKEAAENYIKQSKPKLSYGRWYPFSNKSLLQFYEEAWVEEYEPEILPHNPEIK